MSHNEIRALNTLIDDPDETIYSQVRERIVQMGDNIVPELERAWEIDDSIVARRALLVPPH